MKVCSAAITGEITLEGKPTAGLEVALSPHQYFNPQHYFNRENAIAIGKTDSTGRYLFDCLPMGRYWLKVGAPGYFDPFCWEDEGPGRNVSVADGEFVVNADLHLILGAVLTGRVTDPDGQPVVGEFVELTRIGQLGPPDRRFDLPGEEGDFFTDDNGEYRIYGIPPGQYVVSIGVDVAKVTGAKDEFPYFFHGRGKVDGDHYFEQTFHPGTRNRSHATIIDILSGAIIRDVNIAVGRPIRAYTITGRVIHDETRTPIRHCYLELGYYSHRGYGSSYIGEPRDTDENGNFRVEGLLPGRFFISAQFEDETELYCTPADFEIKSQEIGGLEIGGLEIKAHWGVELRGVVVIEGPESEEAVKRLTQVKLRADMQHQASSGHHSRGCTVKSDGRFVIRGLRPGPVHLSLDFDEASYYFSIVRIEYPDDAGETVSVLPMTLTPQLPSFCTLTIPKDLSPLPKAPTVSPEVHFLPPAPPNQFPPPPTIGSISLSSDYRTSPLSPIPIALPQQALVAGPSELPGPRFSGDLPPLQLSEHGLSGVRLVLSYKNGCIRGHVTYKRENLDCDEAGISYRTGRGSRCSTSTEIDPNGDFFIDGLAPGEYEISILSETKSIVVDNDCESRISFVIDRNAPSD